MKKLMKITALFLAVLVVMTCPVMAATVTVNSTYVDLQVDETWFAQPTTLYNHEMAQASMLLSYAACSGQSAVETALTAEDVGFEIKKSGSYGYAVNEVNLGYTIAKKEIGGVPVYAIVLEDTKAREDWEYAYDFDGAKGTNSDTDIIVPFYNWANHVMTKFIDDVLFGDNLVKMSGEKFVPKSEFEVWIMGFGRGGSVANLMGAMLNGAKISDSANYQSTLVLGSDHVRSYAFAAPAVSKLASEAGMHNNLFVINNPDDLLVYFPGWGFERFGVNLDMRTFYDENNKVDQGVKSAVETEYMGYTGKTYHAYTHAPNTDKGETADDMLTVPQLVAHMLSDIAPSMAEYYEVKKDVIYAVDLNPDDPLSSQASKILMSSALTDMSTYEILCMVFSAVFGNMGREGIVNLLEIVAPTYLKGSNTLYYDTIVFAMKHGLGIYEINDILALVQGGGLGNLTFREMLTAYEPETYLAWMMATNNAEELSMADLPKDEVTIDSFADNTVTYSTENASGLATQVAAAAYTAEGKLLEVLFGDLSETETVEFTTAETIGKVKVFLVDDQWVPLAPADEKTATEVQ